jgi:ankyrin repeat protein
MMSRFLQAEFHVKFLATDLLHLLDPTPEELIETDGNEYTPLSYALEDKRSVVAAKNLIEMDSPLESRNDRGFTPLALAIKIKKHDLVDLLLSAGASVHAVEKYGKSVLMLAAEIGDHRMVARLLERGAAVNSVDQYGQTPLSRAGLAGHTRVVKLLLAKGAVAEGVVNGSQQ